MDKKKKKDSKDVARRSPECMSPLNSEEKVRTILENIQEGYFQGDLAGNFTFFSDSLCRLTGCPIEKLTGEHYTRFSDKDNSKKVFQTFNTVFKTGEPSEGFESLRKNSSDKPVGFRGIVRDITERKLAAEEMEKSEKKFASLFHFNPDPLFHDIASKN